MRDQSATLHNPHPPICHSTAHRALTATLVRPHICRSHRATHSFRPCPPPRGCTPRTHRVRGQQQKYRTCGARAKPAPAPEDRHATHGGPKITWAPPAAAQNRPGSRQPPAAAAAPTRLLLHIVSYYAPLHPPRKPSFAPANTQATANTQAQATPPIHSWRARRPTLFTPQVCREPGPWPAWV